MGHRVDALFRIREIEKRKTLIAFVPVITQSPEESAKNLLDIERAGADLIELRIPDSDDADIHIAFTAAECFRAESQSPLVLCLTSGVICGEGIHAFFARCAEAGVDGVILEGLPTGRGAEFAYAAREFGVRFIRPVSPAFSERVAQIAKESEGYLRCALPPKELADQQGSLQALYQTVRRAVRTPVALGFVSTPGQARELKKYVEAIVLDLSAARSAALALAKNVEQAEFDFIKDIKSALDD